MHGYYAQQNGRDARIERRNTAKYPNIS